MATATAKKSPKAPAKAKQNYNAFRATLEKTDKKVTVTGRSGKSVQARKYSLTADQIAKREQAAKALGSKFVNPLGGRQGVYMFQVQSLADLGLNQWHGLKDVRETMRGLMKGVKVTVKQGSKEVETNLWDAFYHKPAREGATNPLSGDGKIIQNFRVLQRLPRSGDKHPYGLKLAQFCMSVDIEYKVLAVGQEPVPHFRLNTKWAKESEVAPIYTNPGAKRGRKPGKTNGTKPAAKSKAVKTAKAQKAAPKAKATKKTTAPKAKVAKTPKAETVAETVAKTEATPAPVEAPAVEAPVAETPAPVIEAPAPVVETPAPAATEPSAASQEIQ